VEWFTQFYFILFTIFLICRLVSSPNSEFSDCLDAATYLALLSCTLFAPIRNRLLPGIRTKAFAQQVASSSWHYNCFFLLDRMQVRSIFSVCRPDATKPAFGLKKEAQPKFSHRNTSNVWRHPAKRAGGPGMNVCLLGALFAF